MMNNKHDEKKQERGREAMSNQVKKIHQAENKKRQYIPAAGRAARGIATGTAGTAGGTTAAYTPIKK